MDSALIKLMLLQGRGFLRRMVRGATSPRRTILLAVGLGVMLLWLGPVVIAATKMQRSDPARVQSAAPLVLLGVCLITIVTSAGDKAIAFTPGEIDFLFVAPFTRRQLIGYKLGKSFFAAMVTGLFLSLMLLRHARWWPACYLGVLLSLLFVQLFSINAVLIAQTVGARAYSKVRQVVLGGMIVLGLVFFREFATSSGASGGIVDALNRIRESQVGSAVLAPFSVFGLAMTAPTTAALAKWASLAAALDALLLLLAFALDGTYAQAAIDASARRHAQLQRIRGGSFLSIGMKKTARYHLPQPPWLFGAGPIAWRQLTSAFRSARGLLLLLVVVAIGAGPALASMAAASHASHEAGSRIAGTLIGVMLWLTILIATMLKFDFRGDLDQMEVLKSLPICSTALAVGQILIPSLMLAVLHVVILLGAARAMPQYRTAFLAACAFAWPVDLLLYAIENLTFLLFPARPAVSSPGDFQVLGRQVVVMAIKMVVLSIACVPPMAAGYVAFLLSGNSVAVLVLVAVPLSLAEVAAFIPLLAWAFRRFDPSLDTPA